MSSLLFFPGLACDARLLLPQKSAFPDLVVPRYIAPVSLGESLTSYAKRLAETLPMDRPLVLGGISFGASLAQELARVMNPEGLVLISAARAREDITVLPRFLNRLSLLLPMSFVQGVISHVGVRAFGRFEAPLTPAVSTLLHAMTRDADPIHARWAANAIISWNPDPTPPPCPLLHLHGLRDRVIPFPRRLPDVTPIPAGGHLINLTHPEVVNQHIADFLQRIAVLPAKHAHHDRHEDQHRHHDHHPGLGV